MYQNFQQQFMGPNAAAAAAAAQQAYQNLTDGQYPQNPQQPGQWNQFPHQHVLPSPEPNIPNDPDVVKTEKPKNCCVILHYSVENVNQQIDNMVSKSISMSNTSSPNSGKSKLSSIILECFSINIQIPDANQSDQRSFETNLSGKNSKQKKIRIARSSIFWCSSYAQSTV